MTEEPILLDEFTNTSIVTSEMRLQEIADKMDGQEGEAEDESPGQARCGIVSPVCVPHTSGTCERAEWENGEEKKAWGWPVSRLLAASTAEAMPKADPAQTRI